MKISEILTEAKAVKQRLDPKCWKGKHKEGTKVKGGVRVNNCVPNESVSEVFDGDKEIGTTHKGGIVTKTAKGIKHTKTNYDDGNGEKGAKRKEGGPKSRYHHTPILDKDIDEAGSPAQQAAIAINMKKHHKKPKNEDVYSEEELNLLFDSLEEMFEEMGIHEDNYDAFTDENILSEAAAWQTKKGKNKNGGLNAKGVASYRRENPGSKLQTAVTTKPSKLKKGSKAAKRRKSFCARMKGMKKSRTGAKTKRDPNSRINKSLRKWNC